MSVEDPFFVVQGEVNRAVEKCHDLHHCWQKVINEESTTNHYDFERMCKELKNNMQNVEWDLEDLEETISIVQSNSHKFYVSVDELNNRKCFINNTRTCIREIEEQLNNPQNKEKANQILRKSFLSNNNRLPTTDSYSKLHIEDENTNTSYFEDQQQKQTLVISQQEEQLDLVSNQVAVLNNISNSIDKELESQAVILDGFGTDMNNSKSNMNFVMKRLNKFSHLANDRKQWCALGVAGSSVFLIFLLLIA